MKRLTADDLRDELLDLARLCRGTAAVLARWPADEPLPSSKSRTWTCSRALSERLAILGSCLATRLSSQGRWPPPQEKSEGGTPAATPAPKTVATAG